MVLTSKDGIEPLEQWKFDSIKKVNEKKSFNLYLISKNDIL